TFTLKVDPKYHRELIGSGGSQINKVLGRYKVQIFFPKSSKREGEEQPPTNDSASDAGKRRPQQKPDEIVIRGPKKDAEASLDELFAAYKWIQDHSHTTTISVSAKQLPSLIGQGGANLEQLRLDTKADIDIPAARDTEIVDIQIKGTKEAVSAAKKILEE